MLLTQIKIRNFRGIRELTLPLDDLCVFIGENNSGKSTVLDAIRICLSRSHRQRNRIFEDYDYYLSDSDSEPSKAKAIEISLTFSETQVGEWPNELVQIFSDVAQVDEHQRQSIRLRVKSWPDVEAGGFSSEYDFLDSSENPLPKGRYLLNELRKHAPVFYLSSLRDAAKEFRAHSQFWAPFVRSLDIEDKDRAELEAALSELNKDILQRHSAFNSVKERLQEMSHHLSVGESDTVSIEAIPEKVFDILSRTQIKISSKTGARIPIIRHGHGTQSLAVIHLFSAFLNSQLRDIYSEYSQPILALEEPEAHLHPSAIKSVVKMLRDIPGQKFITTHSGDLLADVPLRNIRRLRRCGENTFVHMVDENDFEPNEKEKLNYKVRTTRGALLFSRCWLLVEGESEAVLLPECARAMGHDLHSDGVSLVEFTHIGIDKLITLADHLGIEWLVLIDNDQQGLTFEKSARQHLSTRNESDHICKLDHGNLEVFLCMEGYGNIYQDSVSEQKKSDTMPTEGTLEYWKVIAKALKNKSKIANSHLVAKTITEEGPDAVPALLSDLINKSRELASRAG